jgi:hypothetical protein
MEYFVIRRKHAPSTYTQRIFNSAEAAARYMQQDYGNCWEDYYKPDVATWKERELGRFHALTPDVPDYKHPVWANERFWVHNPEIHAEHFAHSSVKNPTLIAFTESEEKGLQDRQTSMKPGKYLRKYFGDVLNAKQISFYAEWWAKGLRPATELDAALAFASTPDDIERVYNDGPRSCMAKDYSFGIHPSRVYGAGDLAVAYLTRPTGDIIARALTWPEKKVFGRCYPTPDRWSEDGHDSEAEAEGIRDHLFNLLKENGFSHLHEGDNEGFEGARLLKIEGNGGWVGPYLDNEYSADDGGDHWIMSKSGVLDCSNTGGTFEVPSYGSCFSCSSDLETVEDAVTVYTGYNTSDEYPSGEQEICCRCDGHRSFRCEGTDVDYLESYVDRATLADGTVWVWGYFRNNGFICAQSGDNYSNDDRVEMADGSYWSQDAFDTHGFVCKHDGLNYPLDDESSVFPGYAATHDDVVIEDRVDTSETLSDELALCA